MWKENVVFSFIDVYPAIICSLANWIQMSNNDRIRTLLPRKELPWRHNHTNAQREAQRCKQIASRCV